MGEESCAGMQSPIGKKLDRRPSNGKEARREGI